MQRVRKPSQLVWRLASDHTSTDEARTPNISTASASRPKGSAPSRRGRSVPAASGRDAGRRALYRAPRGRGRDGQYYIFCIDHVRQYNASYNYFDGMNDREVEDFQKDALTGHRPTWNVGLNLSNKSKQPRGAANGSAGPQPATLRALDPHGFFAWRARAAREAPAEERRSSTAAREQEPADAQPAGRCNAHRDQGSLQGAG